ncbi:MAG: hypothetical protein ACI9S8_002632 [Chlamydiales bacterium]
MVILNISVLIRILTGIVTPPEVDLFSIIGTMVLTALREERSSSIAEKYARDNDASIVTTTKGESRGLAWGATNGAKIP